MIELSHQHPDNGAPFYSADNFVSGAWEAFLAHHVFFPLGFFNRVERFYAPKCSCILILYHSSSFLRRADRYMYTGKGACNILIRFGYTVVGNVRCSRANIDQLFREIGLYVRLCSSL